MGEKKYQIILMDIDGTLLDFHKAEILGIREVMKAYGVEPTKERETLYREINRDLWERFERNEISKKQIAETRFSLFFQKMGFLSPGTGDRKFGLEFDREAERLYRSRLDESGFLIPGAMEVCRYLSEKYPIYVVTNGTSSTQYKRIAGSGLQPFFQDVFVSEDAGSQKPQPEFFRYCFSKMPPCSPKQMLLVGDSLTSDMKGGCVAGTDTCWYNPQGRSHPYHRFPEKREKSLRIDYEIEDLLQLKEIL